MMGTKTPSQEQVIGNLSGGNQQKVMIGRWLATSPKILILDEPMNGLDREGAAEIRKLFRKLKEEGTTILLSSHHKEDMDELCDIVYEMEDGCLRNSAAQSALTG